MKPPHSISYEELGHDPVEDFSCFSPDYIETDIGKGFDLTVTLFGYQLGEEEVLILVRGLQDHLQVNEIHKILRARI